MNQFEKIEQETTDAGKEGPGPKVSKGGVFSSNDIELVKRALHVYLVDVTRANNEVELRNIANLLHRLNNRI